jgi:CIC family chloride channel protein
MKPEIKFPKIREHWNRATAAMLHREPLLMIVMGGVVGALGGYGAIGFRKLITAVSQVGWGTFTHTKGQALLSMAQATPFWAKIVIPAAGGLIVGIIVYFFSKEAKGHGVPEVMEAVSLKDGMMRTRVVFAKAFATAFCIGSGGSTGREGPIIQIGSAMGSAVGRLMNLSGARLRTLVACGAAAGMAATFNAPMGGILFSLEVILSEFAASQFIPIVVSSVIATALSRHYLGNFPAFVVPAYELLHYSELFLYLILGVLAGVVAFLFIRVLYGTEDIFDRWKFPNFLKPAIGGVIIGCIGLLFPQIFGIGYETITKVLHGEMLGTILIGLLLVKILATSVTLGSGGSGGVFAPSLFMGAVLGGFFGQFAQTLFPLSIASPGAYALVGMGAVVAGTTRAPIAAMLIIFEMTGNYLIILPLMFACTIGLVISTLLSRESIYTFNLVRRGINIHASKELNVLKSLTVSQVIRPEIEIVSPSVPLAELVTRMMVSTQAHLFVVGKNKRIQGHISMATLRPILKDYETISKVCIASDLMDRKVTVVSPDETLDMVMQLFGKFALEEIPVSDKDRLIGTVRKNDIIETYNREICKLDMASGLATSFRLHQRMGLERLALLEGLLLLEVSAPRRFVGKNLAALKLRECYGATVLTIKRSAPAGGGGKRISYILPSSATRIKREDILVVFGLQEDLSRFPRR